MLMSGVCGGGGIRAWLKEKPLLRQFARRRRLFATSCSVASSKKEKVIVISGPTGAGKSRLALELAKRLNGEIISADSVQVYRGLDIGSAKPSSSDRKEVPHHLIDILHPCEDYSVGKFFEDARHATKDVLKKGRVPIVTGGTGLYLRWFIYGKPDVPKASPEIIAEVNSELADLQRDGDWYAAVEFVVKAGDPKARSLAANDCPLVLLHRLSRYHMTRSGNILIQVKQTILMRGTLLLVHLIQIQRIWIMISCAFSFQVTDLIFTDQSICAVKICFQGWALAFVEPNKPLSVRFFFSANKSRTGWKIENQLVLCLVRLKSKLN